MPVSDCQIFKKAAKSENSIRAFPHKTLFLRYKYKCARSDFRHANCIHADCWSHLNNEAIEKIVMLKCHEFNIKERLCIKLLVILLTSYNNDPKCENSIL